MSTLCRIACLAVLAALASSCKKGDEDPIPVAAQLLRLEFTSTQLKADGTSSTLVTVSRTDGVAVTLKTERGSWKESGGDSFTLESGNGTAELLACDSRTAAGCAGSVRVSATSPDGARGSNLIQFLALESCDNGRDDDGDGRGDCADADCGGEACTLSGASTGTGVCSTAGSCVCATGQVESCDNGTDDDCDGATDCADLDCQPSGSRAGASCTASGSAIVGTACNSSGVCGCPGGQAQESTCDDASDNDCDGQVDCADLDCATDSCGSNGLKCSEATPSSCSCPTGAVESCTDGVDNNCDGLADCADAACADQQCKTTGANWVCTGSPGLCEDTSTRLALTLEAARVRLPADGQASTVVKAVLTGKGGPLAGQDVAFTMAGPGTLSAASVLTDADGEATVTFTAAGVAGVTRIEASYTSGVAGAAPVVQTVEIALLAVGRVELVSQQFPVMGVRTSSFQEQNRVTFRVFDTAGEPFPDGLGVTAIHQGLGGTLTSYLGEDSGACSATGLCTLSATTGVSGSIDSGLVTVALHSGSAAGNVSIKLRAAAGGRQAEAVASNIAIVGAKAFGQNLSITCDPKNVPALREHDCSKSFVEANITCKVALADRFNNVLGVARTVEFLSEAGAAGQPTQSSISGSAVGTILVSGYPLPRDVEPFTLLAGGVEEFSFPYADACGANTHNPRDGVVSIIVTTAGEEGFIDGSNGLPANGQYDPGESYIDLGEPFVDANDNNGRDDRTTNAFAPDEQYIDLNGNGRWDGPNGSWDADTLLWAETRVVYTGAPLALASGTGSHWSEQGMNGSPAAPSPAADFSVLAKTDTAPATSELLDLFFTDENFNPPSSETTYAVAPVGDIVSAELVSAPLPLLDERGHVFVQQYCDAADGSGCASVCRAEPCVRTSRFHAFTYGSVGEVKVSGGEKTGATSVRATATLRGRMLSIGVSGSAN